LKSGVSKIGDSQKSPQPDFKKEGLQMISATSLRKRILMREKEKWKYGRTRTDQSRSPLAFGRPESVKSGAAPCHGFLRLRHCVATHSTSG